MPEGLRAGKATPENLVLGLTADFLIRVRLFGAPFLDVLATEELRESAVAEVAEVLEGVGRHQHDGAFTINYIRLRFVAQKPEVA